MPILPLFILIAGALALLLGGELLVRGASSLALRLGMSSLLVGLTVVAFGTSAPELFISVQSALDGYGDIALGNIVGSNICNVLLILGLCALAAPLNVPSKLIRREVPLMVLASIVFIIMALDGSIGRIDGAFLVLFLIGFIVFSINSANLDAKKERAADDLARVMNPEMPSTEEVVVSGTLWKDLILIFSGLVFLYFGSKGFVSGASEIARWFGVSELVIGLTIVALGTSLPEVITSLLATIRGERDLAVGNVVGSNIFNICCVMGIASLLVPIGVPELALQFDLPVMLFSSVAILPIVFSDGLIGRLDGFFFLGGYVVYTTVLVLISKSIVAVPLTSVVFVVFFIPLALLTAKGLYNRRDLRKSA